MGKLKFECDGNIYWIFDSGKIFDESYCEVNYAEFIKVRNIFLGGINYKVLSKDDLKRFIEILKNFESYQLANEVCLFIMQNYNDDFALMITIINNFFYFNMHLKRPNEEILKKNR